MGYRKWLAIIYVYCVCVCLYRCLFLLDFLYTSLFYKIIKFANSLNLSIVTLLLNSFSKNCSSLSTSFVHLGPTTSLHVARELLRTFIILVRYFNIIVTSIYIRPVRYFSRLILALVLIRLSNFFKFSLRFV